METPWPKVSALTSIKVRYLANKVSDFVKHHRE
jgi:hypothetical protein